MEALGTVIRPASPEDVLPLLDIYAPYVRDTAVTFEYDVPSPEEFRRRIETTLKRYPWLVAAAGDELLGYACAGPFHPRAAYAWCAETTVYLRRDRRRRGLGRRLCGALEELAKAQNIYNLNACIACPEGEDDPHLTRDSLRFHAQMGFHPAGEFHRCGCKFGTWYDMVWMEKLIGAHPAQPAPVIPFPALCPDEITAICKKYSL